MVENRFVLLKGDDEFAIENRIKKVFSTINDLTTAQMNISRLDMMSADMKAVTDSAFAMPFLYPTRTLILDNAASPFSGNVGKDTLREYQQKMLYVLNNIPDSTNLLLIHRDSADKKKDEGKYTWILNWVSQSGNKFKVEQYYLPDSPVERERWLAASAKKHGVSFEREALTLFDTFAGTFNPRSLDNEVAKLAAYVNYSRAITNKDVEAVCSSEFRYTIFDLVDAMGNREYSAAIRIYHNLLEEMDPEEIFPMIVRQFRLILQARYVFEKNRNYAEVSKIGGLASSFVSSKVIAQADKFSYKALKIMYSWLLEIDEAVKRSKVEIEFAIELFILESSRKENWPLKILEANDPASS